MMARLEMAGADPIHRNRERHSGTKIKDILSSTQSTSYSVALPEDLK
jgi:hypothetical protein